MTVLASVDLGMLPGGEQANMPSPTLEIWDYRLAIASHTGERCEPSHAKAGSAAALLLGCLAGLALSWQVILSEGARDRVYSVFTDLGYTATATTAS